MYAIFCSTSSLITFTTTNGNMAQSQMTTKLVGLEVDLASVDIKPQIPDAAGENDLSPTQAGNNATGVGAATSMNLNHHLGTPQN